MDVVFLVLPAGPEPGEKTKNGALLQKNAFAH